MQHNNKATVKNNNRDKWLNDSVVPIVVQFIQDMTGKQMHCTGHLYIP